MHFSVNFNEQSIVDVTPPKGSENRKNVGEYKQQDNTKSAQYISKQANIQKVPKLSTNDDLPEVRLRTHRLWSSRTAVQVGASRKVMLEAGVVVAARLPGLSTADKTTRQFMCGIGYRLPVPLVRAGPLYGIERVDGVHDNPNQSGS